uniref:C2H2-type domain-containing protein n=1 Tax=Ananas comosus var. bracteatus TaxID=296719 RepID=A0A6V7Q403_ANACO|nr:unnamed protein product [Ananas comosus var. bracteatus]
MEGGGDDKEPHCCRARGKRFPCGRSLGAHMRSHSSPISSFSSDDDGDYEFAKKMTTRDCTNGGSSVSTTTSSSRTFMELRACLRLPERRCRAGRRRGGASVASRWSVKEEKRSSPRSRRRAPEENRRRERDSRAPNATGPSAPTRLSEATAPIGSGSTAPAAAAPAQDPLPPDDSFGAAVASPESAKKARAHRCPICDKVFGSGQALGGHKRSHLMASSSDRRVRICSVDDESRDLLDLNLPAPVDDDDDEDSSNVNENVEYKSWWVEGEHKHGA